MNADALATDTVPVPRARRVALLASALAVALAALAGIVYLNWGRQEREALRRLNAPLPEARKFGAWIAAQEHAPRALALIAQRLSDNQEADSHVRESYVYALGRSGPPAYADIVDHLALDDADPFVRHAAWVALARLDAERFRAQAASAPPRDYAWDRIGRACGWLEVGDLRGADELLHWAVAGDDQQRRVASQALERGVAPLLETAGRWPLAFEPSEGESWPAELVAEVRARCAELDLEAIATDTRPTLLRAALVRRDVGRITNTRDHIARFLNSQ